MATTINEIFDDFAFLDEWEDRYRYVIELGQALPPFPDAARTDVHKVQGCVSQVWLTTDLGSGADPVVTFAGDSDAHIVKGLVAIMLALFSGKRASEIVAQARLLLSAVEDLDFAAKLRSTEGAEKARCNFGELVERLVVALRETGDQNGVEIEAARSVGELSAAVQPEVAERLILRMCGAVIGRSVGGEHLRLTVDCNGHHCLVSITRPVALHGMSEEDLFGTADDAMSAAFPLRLARGLAHAAGASLVASERRISLVFPKA